MIGKRSLIWERIKWASALIGSGIIFILARNLSAMVEWASVLGFFVTLIGLLLGARPQSKDPQLGLSDLLDQATEDLALAVAKQWRDEERMRRLQDPFPLPIRWVVAGGPITDHWSNIRFGESEDQLDLDSELAHIATVFSKVPSRRLVVLGKPGSGKSCLLIRFALDYIEHRQPGEPVPAIFALSSWDPRCQNLHEWMSDRLAAEHPPLSISAPSGHTWAWELVHSGRVLPVLDGFDEIPESLRCEAMRGLNAGFNRASPLMLTSRSDEYRNTVEAGDVLTSAAVVQLQPLSIDDLAAYLPRTTRPIRHSAVGHPTTKWEPVLAYMRTNPDSLVAGTLLEVLSNPLMTSMARAAYSDADADPSLLRDPRFSDQRSLEEHLLGAFIPALYSAHSGIPRTSLTHVPTDYRPEQAREWFERLARHLNNLGTYDLAWWKIADVIPRRIASALAAVATGISVGPVAALVAGPRVGVVYGIAYGGAAGFVQAMSRRQEPLSVSVRFRGTIIHFLRRFAIGMTAGIAIGIAFGVPAAAVMGEGLTFGIIVALHVWLDTPTDLASVSSPATALQQDRIATIAFCLTSALLCGLSLGFCFAFTGVGIGGPELGPILGVTFGFSLVLTGGIAGAVIGWLSAGGIGSAAYGVATGVAFGCVFPSTKSTVFGLAVGGTLGFLLGIMIVLPKAWGSFLYSRFCLAACCRLPWRLMLFLEDAHNRGVLRQAGPVYQFRHATLQDYMAKGKDNADRSADAREGDCALADDPQRGWPQPAARRIARREPAAGRTLVP